MYSKVHNCMFYYYEKNKIIQTDIASVRFDEKKIKFVWHLWRFFYCFEHLFMLCLDQTCVGVEFLFQMFLLFIVKQKNEC